MPKYNYSYDRGKYFQGDSLPSISIQLNKALSNDPVIPTTVCSVIKDSYGSIVHTNETTIDPVTGKVTVEGLLPSVTRKLDPGEYILTVQYTMSDGRVKRYLTAKFTIVGEDT